MSLKKISSQMDKLMSGIEAANPSEDTIIKLIHEDAKVLQSLINKEIASSAKKSIKTGKS